MAVMTNPGLLGGLGAPAAASGGGLLAGLQRLQYPLIMGGLGLMSGQGNRNAFANAMQGMGQGFNLQQQQDQLAMQQARMQQELALRQAAQKREAAERAAQQQALMAGLSGVDGISPEDRAKLAGDPALARSLVLDSLRKRTGMTDETFGLNPITGVDKDGNPVYFQPGNRGSLKPMQFPEGVSPSKQPIRIDAGTHYILIDPITRQPVGNIPKNLQEAEEQKAQGKEIGKQVGEAQINLPGDIAKAEQSMDLIQKMIDHPGRETATGTSSLLDPRNYIPGTQARDFHVRKKQLEGRVFLEAYSTLRGGGHITEVEGQKAQDAMARLDTAQSEEAYLEALRELQSIIKSGVERARAKARMGGSPQSPGAPEDPLGIR